MLLVNAIEIHANFAYSTTVQFLKRSTDFVYAKSESISTALTYNMHNNKLYFYNDE